MVGIIGVGLLGTAIAERFLARGWPVLGFDRDPARLAALRQLGGETVDSAAAVADRCQRIVLSLPTSQIVEGVIAQSGSALTAGHTLIDTTTGEPAATAARGAALAARGIEYLDATVSGSSAEARAGQSVLMVGGRAEAFAACGDIFAAFARRSFHVGPWGAGASMKLVTNLVLGLNRAALAEGLALARALDLELSAALDVLREGAAYSRAMDAKGQKMIDRDFTPQARLAQHLKDVRLMLEAAEAAGASLPLSTVHRELLECVAAAGFGDEDNAAIVRVYDKIAGKAPRGRNP
jgi:3-hydroxyisobutyrate dehydrogenase-like beta-hydroxyacid dehydrogenase